MPKFPEEPPPGPTRPSFWSSPLRGPWLTSILGSALLPLIVICAVTGFLSQAAYNPDLGHNSLLPGGGIGVSIYFFHWPTSPSWLYAFTQGLHVISGLAAMPILLAKLWSVMPKLFEWPPVRGVAHALERLSLALLVGGSVFVFGTGLLNIQVFYPWPFRFLTAHYYGAFVFLAAFGLHIFLKIPVALRTFRERGVLRPLRPGLADTVAEPYEEGHVAPLEPARPTISRRALLATVGAASLGAAFMAVAQTVGGPIRQFGLLTPRSTQLNDGPNGFQINKTAAAVGIGPEQTGAAWRLADRRRGEARALPRAAAGDAPAQLRPADRLRRRLVDDPALDRGAAARPRRAGGDGGRRRAAGRIAAEGRRAARGDAELRPGRRREQPAGAEGERRGPLARPRLPGPGDRPRRPRRPPDQVGRDDEVRGRLMARFRSAYGDSPLHLLAVLASFAIAGYAFLRIVESPSALGTLVWFAGAAVAHDLIAFPLYSALNLIAHRGIEGPEDAWEERRRVPLINHVRIPAFLAGLALLMFFPLILGLDAANYEKDSGALRRRLPDPLARVSARRSSSARR